MVLLTLPTSFLSLLAIAGVIGSCSPRTTASLSTQNVPHQNAECVTDGQEFWRLCQERPTTFLVQKHAVRGRIEAKDAPANATAEAVPEPAAPAANSSGSVVSTVSTPVSLGPLLVNKTEPLSVEAALALTSNVHASTMPVVAEGVNETGKTNLMDVAASPLAINTTKVAESLVPGTSAAMPATSRELNSVPVPAANAAMPPTSRELNSVVSPSESVDDSLPSESEAGRSIMNDLLFLRGKPQILSILVMMLMPAGLCAVMYCVFSIIKTMEDGQSQDGEDAAMSHPTSGNRGLTLGEMLQPNRSPKRAYEPLCHELLAPPENECIIALPSLNEVNPTPGFDCLIVTKTGTPIVRVSLTRMADGVPDVAGGGSYAVGQTLERISLVAFKRQNALGFCELEVPRAGSGAANAPKCNIYRPTGDLFATLEEETVGVVSSILASSSAAAGRAFGTKCYMLTAAESKTRFWIQGNFAERNLVVVSETDNQKPIITVESGEQLQFKKEGGDYYRLRVQPKVDAGVVIMALLAIDRLPKK